MHYDREGVGSQDDAAAAVGDGTVIAILKGIRGYLITGVAVLGLTFAGSRLLTDTTPAKATAAAPVYGEGSTVYLSTDLAGNLRTSGGGGGGGNPTGGWLDSVRLVTSDSVRKVLGGWLDSLRAGRLDSTGLKRRAALDTLRWLAGGRLDSVAYARRAALDTVRWIAGGVITDTVRDKTPTTGGTIGAVQLGSSTGKTNVLKTGSLTTTATTADQVVLTYTVTAGKTLYLQYVDFEARLTTLSATASILGTISLETPSGTKAITHSFTNPTIELDDQAGPFTFAEGVPIAAGVVVRCVTTPAAATSMLWICNFGGYEK